MGKQIPHRAFRPVRNDIDFDFDRQQFLLSALVFLVFGFLVLIFFSEAQRP